MDNKVTHYYATYAERAQEFEVKAPGLRYAFQETEARVQAVLEAWKR